LQPYKVPFAQGGLIQLEVPRSPFEGNLSFHFFKPPPSKGRCHSFAVTEGLLYYHFAASSNRQISYNPSVAIASLYNSPLCWGDLTSRHTPRVHFFETRGHCFCPKFYI